MEPDTSGRTNVMSRDMFDRCVATSLTNRRLSFFLFWGAGFFDQTVSARAYRSEQRHQDAVKNTYARRPKVFPVEV